MTERVRPDSRQAIAERVRALREAHGLRQVALCQDLKISQTTWNNYERGVAVIPLHAANKLVARFGVGLDWIYRGEEVMLPVRVRDLLREYEEGQTEAGDVKPSERAAF